MEIYEKTVEVLGPEVAKAKDLMRFVNSASARSGVGIHHNNPRRQSVGYLVNGRS